MSSNAAAVVAFVVLALVKVAALSGTWVRDGNRNRELQSHHVCSVH